MENYFTSYLSNRSLVTYRLPYGKRVHILRCCSSSSPRAETKSIVIRISKGRKKRGKKKKIGRIIFSTGWKSKKEKKTDLFLKFWRVCVYIFIRWIFHCFVAEEEKGGLYVSRARHTLLDWTNSYKRTCCETPRDFVRASTALKINLAIGGESFPSIFFSFFFSFFFEKKKKYFYPARIGRTRTCTHAGARNNRCVRVHVTTLIRGPCTEPPVRSFWLDLPQTFIKIIDCQYAWKADEKGGGRKQTYVYIYICMVASRGSLHPYPPLSRLFLPLVFHSFRGEDRGNKGTNQ